MLREISEEVRVNLKDRLRDIRHAVRQRRRGDTSAGLKKDGDAPFPLREIEGLLGHAARAVDDVMSVAETLVPMNRPGAGVAAKGFAAYFPDGGERETLACERAFRRDLYYLASAVLAHMHIEGARPSEASFAAVHTAMRARHGDLLAARAAGANWTQTIATRAALCAALLVECLNHRPIRFGPSQAAGPDMDRTVEINCLASAVLCCGLADGAGEAPAANFLDIAMLAVGARLDRFVAACRARDPAVELTTVFATLLAHLP